MRYLPIGTDEGIRELSRNVGDFAAGETRLTGEQQKSGLIGLPALLIAIVPVYNVPGVTQQLRFSGEILARIYLGEIKNWDAAEIAILNPGVTLPNLTIKRVIRPGGKGTNFTFTEFLSKTSLKFRNRIGVTSSPKWPAGDVAERSSDMVEKVKATTGAIGYVEYQYAANRHVAQGTVLNPAGRFVGPSRQALTAACLAAESPLWTNFSASLTNSAGAESYPIAGFSWIYLRVPLQSAERGSALEDFLDWIFTRGQFIAVDEGYTSLPVEMLVAVRKRIETLR
jgi:phosphate transport system substrate-binding protein